MQQNQLRFDNNEESIIISLQCFKKETNKQQILKEAKKIIQEALILSEEDVTNIIIQGNQVIQKQENDKFKNWVFKFPVPSKEIFLLQKYMHIQNQDINVYFYSIEQQQQKPQKYMKLKGNTDLLHKTVIWKDENYEFSQENSKFPLFILNHLELELIDLKIQDQEKEIQQLHLELVLIDLEILDQEKEIQQLQDQIKQQLQKLRRPQNKNQQKQ